MPNQLVSITLYYFFVLESCSLEDAWILQIVSDDLQQMKVVVESGMKQANCVIGTSKSVDQYCRREEIRPGKVFCRLERLDFVRRPRK